jgi:Ser/Thr protein kinase RdoA (MazF antagonist)
VFNDKAFGELSPDRILSVLEGSGFACDGRLLALNSYENRVYQVGIHEAEPVVAKFYRPGRWSSDAILEEHKFTKELYDSEVPVVPPITVKSGGTLIEQDGFRVSV